MTAMVMTGGYNYGMPCALNALVCASDGDGGGTLDTVCGSPGTILNRYYRSHDAVVLGVCFRRCSKIDSYSVQNSLFLTTSYKMSP
jgi:hypothetical protein